MNKNKLSRLEKEFDSNSMKGSINYMKLESGKYISVNTNDKTEILNELEYLFEGCKINPEIVFNSLEEIKERFGSDFEYNDTTYALNELNSCFVNQSQMT